MSLDGFGAGPFELDAQLAQEFGVPFVFVRFEQAVSLLVGEQVEDEGADWRVVADGVVEDPRVGGRGDGVGTFRQPREVGEDVVAERRGEQAVREGVELEEEEVFGAALGVAQIAVGADVVFRQLGEGVHGGEDGGSDDAVGGEEVASWRWRLQCAGVQPLQKPFKDLGLLFRQADYLIHPLCKCAIQCGGEERRRGRQKFFVNEVLRLRPRLATGLSHDHTSNAGEAAESGSQGKTRRGSSRPTSRTLRNVSVHVGRRTG